MSGTDHRIFANCRRGNKFSAPPYLWQNHYQGFLDFESDKIDGFFKGLQKTCAKLKKGLGFDGFNLLQNNNRAAGQLVDHLHFHIIPRWKNDQLFAGLDKKKLKVSPEDLSELQQLIEKNQ